MTLESKTAEIDAEHGDPNRHTFNHAGIYIQRADTGRLHELGLTLSSPCSICEWRFDEHGSAGAELAQEPAQEEGPRAIRDCVCGHVADEHDFAAGSSWPCAVENCPCLGLEEEDEEPAQEEGADRFADEIPDLDGGSDSAPSNEAEEPEPELVLEAQAEPEELAAGSQMGLPGIEIPRLWPDFEGHRITTIALGISGAVSLRAGDPYHEELAEKLRHLGGRLQLTLETRIESAGHTVIRDKKTGAAIGRSGLSKIAIRRIIDDEETLDELRKLELREADLLTRIDELLEHWLPPEAGDLEALDADELREWIQSAAGNFEAHLRELRSIILFGSQDVGSPAPADSSSLASCALCEHAEAHHDGEGGRCEAIFNANTGDGDPVADICKCEAFRTLEATCAICEHGAHEGADCPTCRECKGEDSSAREIEAEPAGLAGALEEALGAEPAEAEELPSCGKIHRGHMDPCPFPAAECELPEATP